MASTDLQDLQDYGRYRAAFNPYLEPGEQLKYAAYGVSSKQPHRFLIFLIGVLFVVPMLPVVIANPSQALPTLIGAGLLACCIAAIAAGLLTKKYFVGLTDRRFIVLPLSGSMRFRLEVLGLKINVKQMTDYRLDSHPQVVASTGPIFTHIKIVDPAKPFVAKFNRRGFAGQNRTNAMAIAAVLTGKPVTNDTSITIADPVTNNTTKGIKFSSFQSRWVPALLAYQGSKLAHQGSKQTINRDPPTYRLACAAFNPYLEPGEQLKYAAFGTKQPNRAPIWLCLIAFVALGVIANPSPTMPAYMAVLGGVFFAGTVLVLKKKYFVGLTDRRFIVLPLSGLIVFRFDGGLNINVKQMTDYRLDSHPQVVAFSKELYTYIEIVDPAKPFVAQFARNPFDGKNRSNAMAIEAVLTGKPVPVLLA